MDSTDDPEYDPQKDPHYDPDTSYIHGDQQPTFDPKSDIIPALPPDDSDILGDGQDDDWEGGYPNEYPEEYPDDYPEDLDGIPTHVGEGYSEDEMNYDNDGFGDDDDVYLENPAAQYEIESADPKDNFPANMFRNCMLCCACVLVVSGLIVLGIRLGETNADDDNQASSATVFLASPPNDIEDKCNRENVLSENGYFDCERICEAADCCNYPSTLALSCLAGHDEQCLKYHEHCMVLDIDEEVLQAPPPAPTDLPEAPFDIKSKCNIESLRTVPGFEACISICMKAECCWKKDGSVHPCTQLDVCEEYAPCLTMDATDHVSVDIEQEIEKKCADVEIATEIGRNQCIFACSHAACCFSPTEQCPHDDGHFCTQYEPCNKIYDEFGEVIQGGSATTTIPLAPQFLDTACETSSLNILPGYEMCLGACSEAECCWKGDRNCASDSGCNDYASCVNLESLGDQSLEGGNDNNASGIPDAPEFLAAACSDSSLDTPAGFSLCQDACMKAECCWKISSCSSQPVCSDYSTYCANLVARLDDAEGESGSGIFVPEAPNDLPSICDPSKIFTSAGYFEACQSDCSKSECCWKTGAAISCSENSSCQAWSDCTILNESTKPPTLSTPLPTNAPVTPPPPSASANQAYTFDQIFDACFNHDNNVGGSHKSLCEIVCQAGTCCFDDSKACPSETNCKIYDPCQSVHSSKTAEIEKACDGTDLSECVGACAAATCCFTSDISKICDVTSPGIICKQYTSCEILYSAKLNSP